MNRKRHATLIVFLVVAIASTALPAAAETLSWNAVTTYTDGTSIGNATVTYQAYWSTSSALTNLKALGTSSTSTSRTFNVDTEAMARGSVIYFTSKATVGGVDSALASALSWNVPPAATKVPVAPGNLRMN